MPNAATAQHTTASPVTANQQVRSSRDRKLWEVFELLDDNFTPLPERILVAGNYIELQFHFFLTRRRHTRSKLVLRNQGAGSTILRRVGRAERHASRFPAHRIGERPRRNFEWI